MNKLHIKFTVNASMQDGFCNTSGSFYYVNNGRDLPTLQEGKTSIDDFIMRMQAMSELISKIDTTEQQHRETLSQGGTVTCSEVMQDVIGLISEVFSIAPTNLKTTTYNKNKEAVSFHMGTITVLLTK